MATLRWDHAVHFVNAPQVAIETFAAHQLLAVAGGKHPGWGTYNALSYFGLTYIEFLAIADAAELAAAQSHFLLARDAAHLLPQRQALYRVALRSDNIAQTHAALRDRGLAVSAILDGQRKDPQGNLISWRIFTIDGDYQGVVYPFVLQWGESDRQRLATLQARGLARPHPAGPITLQRAVFEVAEPASVAAHWQTLFGLTGQAETLNIGEQQFVFRQGTVNGLAALEFSTANPALKGQTLHIGQGRYHFI